MADTSIKSPKPAIAETFERKLLVQNEALVERWKPFLDAKGAPEITDPVQRYITARLLENQKAHNEATQTVSVFGANANAVLLGMTRQIYPRLFGTRLVATQPMDRPTGQIFYLDLLRDDGSSLGVQPNASASAIDYSKGIVSRNYAADPGEAQNITVGMKLSIGQRAVSVAQARKLKVGASMELMQDLQAYHGLNALDLLQGAATDEITQEIDALILKAVRDAAIAHTTVTFGMVTPTEYQYDPEAWRRRIQTAILKAETAIFKATYRRPNVMVLGVEAWNYMIDLHGFALSPNASLDGGAYGMFPVGTLNQQYEVFVSRLVPDYEIIIGRRGDGFLDGGIVYAPYVQLGVSDRFQDVDKLETRQSFFWRGDVITISNYHYARIRLDPAGSSGIA